MDQLTPDELTRLTDYFAQELDPNDVTAMERWIAASPDRRRFVRDLHRSRLDFGVDATAEALDLPTRVEALSRSLADIRVREELRYTRPRSGQLGRRRLSQGPWFNARSFSRAVGYAMGTIVASALLLVLGWNLLTPTRVPFSSSVAMSTYTTGKGERAMIRLPDGSTILLNVGSKIHVPTNYSSGNRTVQLIGEAHFSVAPLPGAPFTVMSGPSTTRVLGTRFVVRHYETDTAATIAVQDGKVAVGSVVLSAAQATVVTAMGVSRVVPAHDRQFGFARGVLELEYVPLPDAIPELNRWYNTDIRLGDTTLMTKRIVGVFKAGSLTDLISILELTFGVRVVRDGQVLTLYQGN